MNHFAVIFVSRFIAFNATYPSCIECYETQHPQWLFQTVANTTTRSLERPSHVGQSRRGRDSSPSLRDGCREKADWKWGPQKRQSDVSLSYKMRGRKSTPTRTRSRSDRSPTLCNLCRRCFFKEGPASVAPKGAPPGSRLPLFHSGHGGISTDSSPS